MKVEKGFVCITNSYWNNILSSNKIQKGCIWLRKPNFKAINKGEPIFFLEKKSRLLRGYGYFERFEVNSVKKCWEKYGISNGATSFEDFISQINFSKKEEDLEKEVGSIIVNNIKWLKKDLQFQHTNVDFHNAIVSGKTINSEEVELLLLHF